MIGPSCVVTAAHVVSYMQGPRIGNIWSTVVLNGATALDRIGVTTRSPIWVNWASSAAERMGASVMDGVARWKEIETGLNQRGNGIGR